MLINLRNYRCGANRKLNVGYGEVFRESLPGRLPTDTIVHLLTTSRSVTVGQQCRAPWLGMLLWREPALSDPGW